MDAGTVGLRTRWRRERRPAHARRPEAYDSHYLHLLQVGELTGATVEVVPSEPDGTLDLDALDEALSAGRAGAVPRPPTWALTVGWSTRSRRWGPPADEPRRPLLPGCLPERGPAGGGREADRPATSSPRPAASGCAGRVEPASSSFAGPSPIACGPPEWVETAPCGSTAITTTTGPASNGSSSSKGRSPPISAWAWPSITPPRSVSDPSASGSRHWESALRGSLLAIDGVAEHDGGRRRSGIVTFTVAGHSPTEVKSAAAGAGVNVSVSEGPVARLDMGGARPESVVRASPHYYNTDDELDALVEVVRVVGTGR